MGQCPPGAAYASAAGRQGGDRCLEVLPHWRRRAVGRVWCPPQGGAIRQPGAFLCRPYRAYDTAIPDTQGLSLRDGALGWPIAALRAEDEAACVGRAVPPRRGARCLAGGKGVPRGRPQPPVGVLMNAAPTGRPEAPAPLAPLGRVLRVPPFRGLRYACPRLSTQRPFRSLNRYFRAEIPAGEAAEGELALGVRSAALRPCRRVSAPTGRDRIARGFPMPPLQGLRHRDSRYPGLVPAGRRPGLAYRSPSG